ncbi:methyltransferase domain-containing protein [Streptomyces kronopolitis]|uniref:methyltransferase domain-containing protein n=1 Tax=Streptomyces kronopolitis TaxID=1612435 RepID=UPI003D97E3D0
MSEVQSHLKSLERCNRAMTDPGRPRTFFMTDREWDLLDEVFPPVYSPSTGIALDFLGLTGPHTDKRQSSLLEVGCGTGVISVQAALAGCTVTAVDINEKAVENTRLNVRRHSVADRVTTVHSDLFATLDDGMRFDRIFWSSNYVLAPADYSYRSIREHAYVDPGYRTHRRYLTESMDYLTDNGSVLLHFCDRGDMSGLEAIAAECGRRLRVLRHRPVLEGADLVEHMLIEVLPTQQGSGSHTERIVVQGGRRGARHTRKGAITEQCWPARV